MPSATAKGGSMRSHSAPIASKYAIISRRNLASPPGHWSQPRNARPGNDVGVVGAAIMADEKLSFLVRPCPCARSRRPVPGRRSADRDTIDRASGSRCRVRSQRGVFPDLPIRPDLGKAEPRLSGVAVIDDRQPRFQLATQQNDPPLPAPTFQPQTGLLALPALAGLR